MRRSGALILGILAGVFAGAAFVRRRHRARRTRRPLLRGRFDALALQRLTGRRPPAAARAPDHRRSADLTNDELKLALRDAAYLEGDFVLRSGKRSRYYLDKYRFETRPDILAALGERIAAAVEEVRAGRRAASGAGARRGRTRRRGLAGVGPSFRDRAEGGEGVRHVEPARRRLRSRASASVSWKTSSPPAGR